ncbi:ATP-binding protein [Paradesertivirga mongoliensis]|uniref:histidine kinase n=1 Tax=Paradesertivirga mongoliensis TaxID=2100740 RepID=A0ABW4ZR26_9SPHI|nr:ATP-binding protein [Pedobacter mongoliensis]
MRNAQSIFYLIGTTILLIVINTIFFLFQTSKNEKNHAESMKTYAIIETATELLNNLENAETQHRAYLLSQDSSYIPAFNLAEQQLDENYIKLYSLLNDSPSQLRNLNRLNELVELKRRQIRRTLSESRLPGADAVYRNSGVEQVKNTELRIRTLINTITNTEKKNLDKSNVVIEKLTRRIQVFTVISNWILLIIVISALINIIQSREKIEKLFKEVGQKNKQLEAQKVELQTLSQDLIKQNTELERFAYVASHDLRSPGVNLIALLQLYDDAEDVNEKESLIKIIKEVADNLIVKLDDLIDLLRNKHESFAIHEKLSFMQVFTTVEKNLTADIKRTKAKIQFDFSEVPVIHYPKSYLESIMQNLLSNAIKYRHPERQPEIFIRTFEKNQKTFLEVRDNGRGIDLKQHGKNLFGIYKTFHDIKDSKGVGLYITKAQIIAMGGTIDVESQPNKGSTFTVCFN